jgi:hypothetical protein
MAAGKSRRKRAWKALTRALVFLNFHFNFDHLGFCARSRTHLCRDFRGSCWTKQGQAFGFDHWVCLWGKKLNEDFKFGNFLENVARCWARHTSMGTLRIQVANQGLERALRRLSSQIW